MKIRPVGAELFHADGRTDMKLIVAFRNFANAPYIQFSLSSRHFILSEIRFSNFQIPTPFTDYILILQIREHD